MAADQETVDRVRSIDVDAYKYGFVSRDRVRPGPEGAERRHGPVHFAKKEEPEWLLEWRLEAFRRWLTMDEPKWARVSYPPIDYQNIYYFAAPKSVAGAEVARRGRSGAAAHLRQARHPAGRAGDPCRRRAAEGGGRRRFRFGFGRHDLQGGARQGGRHLLLVLRGGPKSSRSGAPLPRLGRAAAPTTSMRR